MCIHVVLCSMCQAGRSHYKRITCISFSSDSRNATFLGITLSYFTDSLSFVPEVFEHASEVEPKEAASSASAVISALR